MTTTLRRYESNSESYRQSSPAPLPISGGKRSALLEKLTALFMAIDKEALRESGRKFGKKGGNKTLKLYGKKHFQDAVKIRWEREKAKKAATKNEPRNRARSSGGNR